MSLPAAFGRPGNEFSPGHRKGACSSGGRGYDIKINEDPFMSPPTPPVLEIHSGIVLKGRLSMVKDVVLTGKFEGELQTLGCLTVALGGAVTGTIDAGALVLEPGNLVEARVKVGPPPKGPAGRPRKSKRRWEACGRGVFKSSKNSPGPEITFSMKKPILQEVTCPHCHATQSEPAGAISTNCRSCGRYFKVGGKSGPRMARAPKANREVFCVKCGAPNLVASAALSTQCVRCSQYLELGDKVLKGAHTEKLYAYDDVLFAEGCSFKGMEATGRRMEVRGKVFSKLRATEEIVAMPGSHISGELHALVVRIERGATVKVEALACARLLVSGTVEIRGALTASEIILSDGAVFSGRLELPGSKLRVEAGVSARFDSILCDEITVGGQVTLGTSLAAERIAVLSGGALTSPAVRAACIEVNPGGSFQALIEKYVPRKAPKEPDEAEAEAA